MAESDQPCAMVGPAWEEENRRELGKRGARLSPRAALGGRRWQGGRGSASVEVTPEFFKSSPTWLWRRGRHRELLGARASASATKRRKDKERECIAAFLPVWL